MVTVFGAVFYRQEGNETGIHGRVILQGVPPPEIAMKLDALTSQIRPEGMMTHFYDVSEDGGLPNVVVHLLSAPDTIPCDPTPPLAVMEIVRGRIEPYVLAIQTNQLLAYRNQDSILHNAHVTTGRDSHRDSSCPATKNVTR